LRDDGLLHFLLKIPDSVTRKPEGLPGTFLIFAGPRPAGPAGSIQPLISEGIPLGGGNGPRGPTRGKGQRGTAGGTAAWPAGLPQPPHLVAGTPRCPPRPGRQKNGPERPLGAPTKSHSLIRKRPRGAGVGLETALLERTSEQTYCQKPLRAAHKAPLRNGTAGVRARSFGKYVASRAAVEIRCLGLCA
jgi:hypothetical protein